MIHRFTDEQHKEMNQKNESLTKEQYEALPFRKPTAEEIDMIKNGPKLSNGECADSSIVTHLFFDIPFVAFVAGTFEIFSWIFTLKGEHASFGDVCGVLFILCFLILLDVILGELVLENIFVRVPKRVQEAVLEGNYMVLDAEPMGYFYVSGAGTDYQSTTKIAINTEAGPIYWLDIEGIRECDEDIHGEGINKEKCLFLRFQFDLFDGKKTKLVYTAYLY